LLLSHAKRFKAGGEVFSILFHLNRAFSPDESRRRVRGSRPVNQRSIQLIHPLFVINPFSFASCPSLRLITQLSRDKLARTRSPWENTPSAIADETGGDTSHPRAHIMRSVFRRLNSFYANYRTHSFVRSFSSRRAAPRRTSPTIAPSPFHSPSLGQGMHIPRSAVSLVVE